MTLFEIAGLFDIPCLKDEVLTGICIDSRQVAPGNLFVAIQGEQFDGHDFIQSAVAKGAVAILCQKALADIEVLQLVVADTTQALADIATYYRQQFDCEVIALTGSNGKTTVKEMIAAILPKPAHATFGNLNNHLGVPLSVLQLQTEHRYAVFELGANHPGEIAHTVAIVKPKVTLINNIAPAHIEGFGSIEGVAHAKGEIHQGLVEGGTAVINADDAFADFWEPLLENKKTLRFSIYKPSEIYAHDIHFNDLGCAQFTVILPEQEVFISLNVPGIHNVSNALAAIACTYALGIELTDIASMLNQFTGVAGRMTYKAGKNCSRVIDDTYNANLRSVLSALEVLAKQKGTRIFVFGDMGELGAWTKAHHEEIGLAAQEHGIEELLTCGAHSEHTSRAFGPKGRHYWSQAELVQDLLPRLDPETVILVKGSRSAAMENIVHALT